VRIVYAFVCQLESQLNVTVTVRVPNKCFRAFCVFLFSPGAGVGVDVPTAQEQRRRGTTTAEMTAAATAVTTTATSTRHKVLQMYETSVSETLR